MKLSVLSLLLQGVLATQGPPPLLNNANQIFNAIHASMRQWGSSIHHNGMSFFLATVPAGTRLYHGNADPNPIQEIGWMASEPEHAMVFARPRRPRGGPPPYQDQNVQQQETLNRGMEQEIESGWLHTYETARELRLLYIDGTSAGKSRIGTLDLQDRVLFNDTVDGGVSVVDERARKVCELARTEWQGRLDGAIRMAAGFEIIFCSPEETFDMDLWPDSSPVPRLEHLSAEDLSPLRDNLTSLILDHEPDTAGSVNWQAVAGMILARYGRFLQGLVHEKHHGHRKEHEKMPRTKSPQAQFSELMDGFGDDPEESIALCSTQFLSAPTGRSPLAHQSLYNISHKICSNLIPLQAEQDDKLVCDTVRNLIAYLDWTIWKECRGCRGDEFCAIPIWPWGSKKDFEKPKCRKFEDGWGSVNDYWGEIWH